MPTAMACDRTHTFLRAMSLHIGISVVLHNGFLNVQTITEAAVSQKMDGLAVEHGVHTGYLTAKPIQSAITRLFWCVVLWLGRLLTRVLFLQVGSGGYFDSNQLSPNPKSTLSGTSSGSVFSISDRTSAITSWTYSLGHSTTSSS